MATMRLHTEKRLLQCVVALACLVPIMAGLSGVLLGADFLHGQGVDLDSHFRYLSGLLLGIGLTFACSIRRVERHTARVQTLTLIVIIGGLARLYGLVVSGIPEATMVAALGMELVVTPALCLWQRRIARAFARIHPMAS